MCIRDSSGTITVTDDTAASDSAGISVDWTGTVDIWNSGTIQADYAILRDFGFTGGDGTLSIYNSGNLIGDVDLLFTEFAGDTRNVRLINTGSIDGEVKLTDGNDLFDSRIGCLLYTSDAADERSSVDLGGRRIIKK